MSHDYSLMTPPRNKKTTKYSIREGSAKTPFVFYFSQEVKTGQFFIVAYPKKQILWNVASFSYPRSLLNAIIMKPRSQRL